MIEGYQNREKNAERGATSFNEFVFDAVYSEHQLPGAIEAFFYPIDNFCEANSRCKPYAQRVHEKFLREYRVSADEYPLLTLRLDNWKHPFAVAPPAPPPSEIEY